ncbi:MAG TPA: zf-HC2 domain-containing protein [Actinospica sp.]|jgi:hypothetical protein|nr:zf-HC2 domain-containing protein [Actinospica sp.]
MTDWRRFVPRRRAPAGRLAAGAAAPELVCREVVELVTAYLDDALEPAQRAALERHLVTCPHCTEYFAQISLVREAAGRVEPEDVAPRARQDLMDLFTRWQADPAAATRTDGGTTPGAAPAEADSDPGSGTDSDPHPDSGTGSEPAQDSDPGSAAGSES